MLRHRFYLLGLAAIAACQTVSTPTTRSAAQAIGEDALVGEWLLAENDGQTAADTSGNANAGTLGATAGSDADDPTWTWEGPSLLFDGSVAPQYVRVPDAAVLEPTVVTVEAWVRAGGSPGAWRYIVGKGGQDCSYASYALATGGGGGVVFYVFDGAALETSPEADPALWDGSWHHIAGTFDGAFARLYVDGSEVGAGTATTGTQIQYALAPSNDLYIGTYGGTCDLPFTGGVRAVRVYGRALSADEVAARFADPGASPPQNTIINCLLVDCGGGDGDPPPPPPPDPPGTQTVLIPASTIQDELHALLTGSELHISSLENTDAGPHTYCDWELATPAEQAACRALCLDDSSPEASRCFKGCSFLQECRPLCGDPNAASFFRPGFNLAASSTMSCASADETCPSCVPGSPTSAIQTRLLPLPIPPFYVGLVMWTCSVTSIDWDLGSLTAITDGAGIDVHLAAVSALPTVTCAGGYDFDVTNVDLRLVLSPYIANNTIKTGVSTDISADVAVDGRWDPVASDIAHDKILPPARNGINKALDQADGAGVTLRDRLAEAGSKLITRALPGSIRLLSVQYFAQGIQVKYVPDCVANCDGKSCGDDGCGGSCGTCNTDENLTCSSSGQCVCVPHCDGHTCGDDGCGGTCAPGCASYQSCEGGYCYCTNPTPYCNGRCGRVSDGCGGTITCPACACHPSCAGKRCGQSNGCGGLCSGTCAKVGYYCESDADGDYYCARGD